MVDVAKLMYEGQPASTDTLLYTAPATQAVVRAIHAANVGTLTGTLQISLNAGTQLTQANAFFWNMPIQGGGFLDWSGFQVLGTVQTIHALQDTGTLLTLTISGVEQ